MPTLTLQLVFDPSNLKYAPAGRFLPCVGAPTITSSKIWISDSGSGTPAITKDTEKPCVQVVGLSPNTPSVWIRIVGSLPTGYTWGTGDYADSNGGYALRITSVFGRARHSGGRDQDFASPFGAYGSVAAVFDQSFTASYMNAAPDSGNQTANQAAIQLGQAQYPTGGSSSVFVYAFNVGATAFITSGGKTNLYTFGHDPDMDVGN